jgi:hypothetical protein
MAYQTTEGGEDPLAAKAVIEENEGELWKPMSHSTVKRE